MHVVHDRPHDNPGVDLGETRLRGLGLRRSTLGVARREESLALEIGDVDDVAIDDRHRTDSGPDELLADDRSKRPASHDEDTRLPQAALAFLAKARKALLSEMSILEFVQRWIPQLASAPWDGRRANEGSAA